MIITILPDTTLLSSAKTSQPSNLRLYKWAYLHTENVDIISHHTHPHTTSYLDTQGHIVLHTGAFGLLGFCSLVLKLMLVRILKKGIFKYIYTAYTSGYFIYKILVNKCCFFFSPLYLFAQGLNTDPQRNSFKDNCDNDCY